MGQFFKDKIDDRFRKKQWVKMLCKVVFLSAI